MGYLDQVYQKNRGPQSPLKVADPIAFAKSEWPGGFDWLSADEDRGAFLMGVANTMQDSLVIGAKETAKSLTFSVLALWLMLVKKKKFVGIIAGSEDQGKVTYAHLRRLATTGVHTSRMLAEPPREVNVRFSTGAEAYVYAASYYRAHGRHPDVVIADEAVLAAKAQNGEVLKGALESVTTGGLRIMGSAPYYFDPVFMETWSHAEERGYKRYGPWRKHPWQELEPPFATQVDRRPWLPIETQVREAKRAMSNPLSNYKVFWLGELEAGVGDVFPPEMVDAIITDYDLAPIPGCRKAMGVDTGFGSSMFGIVGLEERDGGIVPIMAEQHERPNFNVMANAVAAAYHEDVYNAVMVDSSNPAFIAQLKVLGCNVLEVNFQHVQTFLSGGRGYVERKVLRVDRRFVELVWQMKNARFAPGGRKLDKASTSGTFDEVDALLCALEFWSTGQGGRPVVRSRPRRS